MAHTAEHVVEQMQALHARYGVRKIFFSDEAIAPRNLKSLSGRLAELGSPFVWGGCARFEKTSFSALGAPGLADRLRELARPQVVVTGIETHVCVNQTVHGLLAAGCQPHVVRDAISARFALEDETGFAKLVGSGAVPSSVESVLFEWLRDSRNPAFKAVQKLVV